MRIVYLFLSLAGLAEALRKSPAQEARGFVVTKFCQVRVLSLAHAKTWAGSVGAAMRLVPPRWGAPRCSTARSAAASPCSGSGARVRKSAR